MARTTEGTLEKGEKLVLEERVSSVHSCSKFGLVGPCLVCIMLPAACVPVC